MDTVEHRVKRGVAFVSSLSVYSDGKTPGQEESAPVAVLQDPTVEEVTGETHGGLKVLCERVAGFLFSRSRSRNPRDCTTLSSFTTTSAMPGMWCFSRASSNPLRSRASSMKVEWLLLTFHDTFVRMIERTAHSHRVVQLLDRNPVVALLGARQVGKTTLARQIGERTVSPTHSFDLEHPGDRAVLADPMLTLSPLDGLVVLDEIQHLPEVFPVLRVLVDRPSNSARFLVLGSASEALLRQGSESLAGRIAFHELGPFSLAETGAPALQPRWLRGGFPRSFLASDDEQSLDWRRDFVRTFLQRDLPQLGVTIPAATLERFWSMLAHGHGQLWNGSRIARGFGVAHTTARRWLDLLTATFVVRVLRPWHANLSKRQVKTPKAFIADTGLLHALHDIPSLPQLERHPIVGPSWESFGIETVVERLGVRWDQCYFWATHQGAELDLIVAAGDRRLGFEFKRTSAPKMTRSMRTAMEDLGLESLDVIHAGTRAFLMADDIRAVPLESVLELIEPLAWTK